MILFDQVRDSESHNSSLKENQRPMAKAHVQNREFLASRLDFLITTPEVLRLVNDITTCTMDWLDRPRPGSPGGLRRPGALPLLHHLSAAQPHGSPGLHLS